MSLTALQLVQSACRETNIVAPTTLVSVTSSSDLQLLNLFYNACRVLRNERIFPQQKKTYVFNLANGTTKYALPPDYYAALPSTQWDDSRLLRMIGPLSDANFTARTRGISVSTVNVAYRIFGPDMNPNSAGGQFMVNPSPSSTTELSFEYVSKNLFLPPNWTPSETGITVGKYRNANGNNYLATATTTGTCGTTAPSVTTGTQVDGGVTWTYQTASYETVVTDNDFCVFDDDVIIASLKYRYLASKALTFDVEKAEYEELLGGTISRLQGSWVGRMDNPKSNRSGRYSLPDGDWGI